jgi:NAD(P)-dependent dehydrogenase (short-subunit alcohol dehydrogenase family)
VAEHSDLGERLQGRVALVTGGGGGIGSAVSRALAREGASVLVNDVGARPEGGGADPTVAERVAAEINESGGVALANGESIATMAGAQRAVASAVNDLGGIDILVLCAGNTASASLSEASEADWDAVIEIHLKGHFACMQAAVPTMKAQGFGRIVTITSTVGLFGLGTSAAYASAKAGIVALTKSAALELGSAGITVNSIAPSAVSRMSNNVPVQELERRAVARGKAPLAADLSETEKRNRLVGDPSAVAEFATFLAGKEAADINGQVFFVRGGHIGVYGPYTEVAVIDKATDYWTVQDLLGSARDPLTQAMPDVAAWWGKR